MKKNHLIEKYTSDRMKFEFAPDRRFIKVYINGRFNGFIWNIDRMIVVNGDEVNSSEFFN